MRERYIDDRYDRNDYRPTARGNRMSSRRDRYDYPEYRRRPSGGIGTKLKIFLGNIAGAIADRDDYSLSERPYPREYYEEEQYYRDGHSRGSAYGSSESRRAFAKQRKAEKAGRSRTEEFINSKVESIAQKGVETAKEVAKKGTNALMDKLAQKIDVKQAEIIESRKQKNESKIYKLKSKSAVMPDTVQETKQSKIGRIKDKMDEQALKTAESRVAKYQEATSIGPLNALKAGAEKIKEFTSGRDDTEIEYGEGDKEVGVEVLGFDNLADISLQERTTYRIKTDRPICINLDTMKVECRAQDRGKINLKKKFKVNEDILVGEQVTFLPSTMTETVNGNKEKVRRFRGFWCMDEGEVNFGKIKLQLSSNSILLSNPESTVSCRQIFIHGSANDIITVQFYILTRYTDDVVIEEDDGLTPDECDEEYGDMI